VDPVRDVAQLLERREQLRVRRLAVQRDGERDQALLGAVMEIALESAALAVGRLDNARA
jgi:hypothetical protein